MKTKLFLSILLLAIFSFFGNAQSQTSEIDSINKLIGNSKIDTTKINLLLKKAELMSSISLDSTIAIYEHALAKANISLHRKAAFKSLKELSRNYAIKGDSINAEDNLTKLKQLVESSNDSVEIGEMIGSSGVLYSIRQNHDKAIPLLVKATGILQRYGRTSVLPAFYNSLGISYWKKGNFPQALLYMQIGVKIAEKEKKVRLQVKLLTNIAGVQSDMRDITRAEQTYKQAITIARKNNLTRNEVYAYSNLSSLAVKKKEWKSAYESAIKAIELARNIGDQGILSSSLSKAAISLAGLSQFDEATKLAQQAIDLNEIVGRQFTISQAYSSMGIVLLNQKKYKEAIPYFEKAISGDNMEYFSVYTGSLFEDLSECYEKTEMPKKALQSFKKSSIIKDSVRNRENIQKATEQNMNFEFDKKQALAKAEQNIKDTEAKRIKNQQYFAMVLLGVVLLTVGVIAFLQYRSNRNKQKANLLLRREKRKVEATLTELKATQTQLIQSEKMASLGELTAGIAHEIQNPLNFVNNFSELNKELVDEAVEELEKGDFEETKVILKDIGDNSGKINHHGKRADAIVKGMLAHSRTGKGEKTFTDLNLLAEEYLKLSYHGLRARDKSFNADFKTDFDATLPKMEVIPQDMGRVLLNLINNAFQAVAQKDQLGFNPLVTVSTKNKGNSIEIAVKDNGPGIPVAIRAKIFQPFFTTKPTGQGTGLGLSLSYDIVKAHGGELTVETKEGEGLPAGQTGSTFYIEIPIV